MNNRRVPLVVSFAALTLSTAAAHAQCTATLAQTEGPYWRAGSPERYDLRLASDTDPTNGFTIAGRVLDTSCNPIPYAWIDVWHADVGGNYDNTSANYNYRGHLFADAQGYFSIQTIKPGLYPGRTRHTHIKIDGTNTAVLTTQLYYPGEAQNATDGIFNSALVMATSTLPDGSTMGSYEFHVAAGQACTAPAISTQPVPLAAPLAVGANASFTLAYTGSGPAAVRWHRNGQALANSGHISGVFTTTLTISGASAADAGTYTCLIGNSCGTATSNAMSVSIVGACPADMDNGSGNGTLDNAVDITDLLYFLVQFEAGALPADLDNGSGNGTHDSAVDINDLLFFLVHFEAGC